MRRFTIAVLATLVAGGTAVAAEQGPSSTAPDGDAQRGRMQGSPNAAGFGRDAPGGTDATGSTTGTGGATGGMKGPPNASGFDKGADKGAGSGGSGSAGGR